MTEKKPTILVTGSNGQVGSELKELAPLHTDLDFVFLSRNELPLDNDEIIRETVARYRPQFVINCAAYTAVDKAETENDLAFQINATAVGTLAAICKELQAKFIHISTDYVFDGSRETPLTEHDPVSPVNTYGESKLAGEEAARQKNPDTIILRTSWVYSYHGKNFVKTMIRLMNEKPAINVVNDQWGSPTYAADLADAILQIVKSAHWQPGIYHYSNEGVITWFEFARAIGAFIHTTCDIQPTTTADFPTLAKRPRYSVMDKRKVQENYGLVLKPWKDSLQKCMQRLTENMAFH